MRKHQSWAALRASLPRLAALGCVSRTPRPMGPRDTAWKNNASLAPPTAAPSSANGFRGRDASLGGFFSNGGGRTSHGGAARGDRANRAVLRVVYLLGVRGVQPPPPPPPALP